jgi:glucosamine-6-phosphate deaminase
VTLTASTLAANARFFKNPEQVPRQAVSMGVRTIFSARKILVVLNGPQKAAAAAAMLQGPITPAAPASVLQLHRHVVVVMDEAAAKGL